MLLKDVLLAQTAGAVAVRWVRRDEIDQLSGRLGADPSTAALSCSPMSSCSSSVGATVAVVPPISGHRARAT
jgi:hypothetical protein